MNARIPSAAADGSVREAADGAAPEFEVIIIGAGFSGLGAAIKLEKAGIGPYVVLEQADDLGGTWRDNHYPGCAVDIVAPVYSYSFEQRSDWSRMFAPQREMKAYADHCADKYGVRRAIRYGQRVERARFDEVTDTWVIDVEGGRTVTGRYLVMATGALSQPKLPDIEGLDRFAGKAMHTARWDDDHDLTGRRVAVIGTGATAVQLVPAIADAVEHLEVYQRTPVYLLPKSDPEIPPWLQWTFAHVPLVRRFVRKVLFALTETIVLTVLVYNRRFRWLTALMRRKCLENLERQIPDDPQLRERLTPHYDFGCKRHSFSNDYWATFTRDNVELVTDPIARVTPDGIETDDGRARPVDTLILATGFKITERGNIPPFPVVGRDGLELEAYWTEHRMQAYQGVTVPRFPNLFFMVGPYSLIASSWFATIEGHATHLVRCIEQAKKRDATRVEVTQRAHDEHHQDMRRRQANIVFYNADCTGSNSYYYDEHGDVPLLRPTSVIEHHLRHRFFRLSNYRFS